MHPSQPAISSSSAPATIKSESPGPMSQASLSGQSVNQQCRDGGTPGMDKSRDPSGVMDMISSMGMYASAGAEASVQAQSRYNAAMQQAQQNAVGQYAPAPTDPSGLPRGQSHHSTVPLSHM